MRSLLFAVLASILVVGCGESEADRVEHKQTDSALRDDTATNDVADKTESTKVDQLLTHLTICFDDIKQYRCLARKPVKGGIMLATINSTTRNVAFYVMHSNGSDLIMNLPSCFTETAPFLDDNRNAVEVAVGDTLSLYFLWRFTDDGRSDTEEDESELIKHSFVVTKPRMSVTIPCKQS